MGRSIAFYQVDAFAERLFTGNPAGVCPLDRWLEDRTMQAIAEENNLAETAFFVRSGPAWDLRWFTPTQEVDLCGHATLASAFVIFNFIDPHATSVTFGSRSGPLVVTKDGDSLSMRFPRLVPEPCAAPAGLLEGLGMVPVEVLRTCDYLVVYESEDQIRALTPNMGELAKLDARGVIVTARGKEADFVSRFFAPGAGVPEDPVTGSAHCTLVPYWAAKLGRSHFRARQLSRRGGELICEDLGDAVRMAGKAVLYLRGTIEI